jgi:hypothetical protein
MSQKVVTKILGLDTFHNELELQEGSLLIADDCVIDRDNIVESRRGFFIYSGELGSTSTKVKQTLEYKGRILAHYDSNLAFDDGAGNFSTFSGIYPELLDGLRIKGSEINGNFYFTTSDGIKKISATSGSQLSTAANYITNAGALKALDIKAHANYETAGFLNPDSVTAYRVIWGYKDANNVLILGSPSPITTIRNIDMTESCTIDLEFVIPDEADVNREYFYQVYRASQKTPYTQIPEDELNLVIEDFPSNTDYSNGYVSINDATPEDFRDGGAICYTNAVSGQGIGQSNERPPIARDLATFKGSTFYGNTVTRHQKTLNLLSMDNFSSGSSSIIFANKDQATSYIFRGTPEQAYVDFTGYSPVGSISTALDGKYFLKNSASNEREYFFWFDGTGGSTSTPTDPGLVGKLGVKLSIGALSTSAEVAMTLEQVLNTMIDFTASVSSSTKVLISNSANGNTTDIAIGTLPAGITVGTTTQGTGEDVANKIILLSSQVSNAQRIDESARSILEVVNRNGSEIVIGNYLSGVNDVPGQMYFENKTLSDVPFYIAVNDVNIANKFNPKLPVVQTSIPVAFDTPSQGYCRFTLPGHDFVVGDKVVCYNSIGVVPSINGVHTVTNVATNTFDIAFEAISGGTCDLFMGSVVSDNEVSPNRLYYSKAYQPEAVPALNYFDVGSKDKAIVRTIALRDSLFILKEDAIYRLTGTSTANFIITLLDASAQIIAPDSAAVLNNQIYCLTNQGVVTITDSGVSVISRKIEDQIFRFTSPTNYPDFSKISFGVSYESDRAYMLWLPTNTEDTYGTQCFRFNVFTQAWVRWILPQTCGIVNKVDNKLYLGCGDVNHIAKERKNSDRSDYADRAYTVSLLSNAVNGTAAQLSSLSNVELYDVLYQSHYISIVRFNRLLSKLDHDPLLKLTKITNYSTLEVGQGDNMADALVRLYQKIIVDDTIGSYTAPSGVNDILTIRDEFNRLMDELNVSDGVFYSDYAKFTDIIQYEGIITAINKNSNTVTLPYEVPFLEGEAKIYKAIISIIEWAPQHLGDPTLWKQFRQAYFMFMRYNFTYMDLGVRSDLSDNVEFTAFSGEGNGAFGSQIFGSTTYGGLGSKNAIRTYIPRNKQRGRYILMRLVHHSGREQFSCVGYALTYNQTFSDNQLQ